MMMMMMVKLMMMMMMMVTTMMMIVICCTSAPTWQVANQCKGVALNLHLSVSVGCASASGQNASMHAMRAATARQAFVGAPLAR